MEEEQEQQEPQEKKSNWAVWVILPLCVAGAIFGTKWLMTPKPVSPDAMEYNGVAPKGTGQAEYSSENRAEKTPARTSGGGSLMAPVSLDPDAEAEKARQAAAAGEPAPVDERAARDSSKLGFTYGAISRAVGKILNNPKAVSAILNNKYVVNGFMSRDTVKKATGSGGAAMDYLTNSSNVSAFLNKPVVKAALNNPAVVDAAIGSGLVSALLDTPGGKSLMSDPKAMNDIVNANPDLLALLANPNVVTAMVNNPRTAGMLGQIKPGGGR